jgi:DNA-binding NtrC family response regulator
LDRAKVLSIGKNVGDWLKFNNLLRSLEFEVNYSENCRTGWAELESDSSIDVVIIDTFSTDDCGMQLAGRAARDMRLQWLPIIVAGSSFSPDLVRRFTEVGVRDIMLLPVEPATLQAKIMRARHEGKRTILVVDDESTIRQLLRDILSRERFRVLTAETAEEAMKLLNENKVHVLVSDIVLPGMNGTELMVQVKETRPQLPVILITGNYGRFKPEDAIAAGADGYFAKPFKNLELVYTLRRLLQGRGRPKSATPPKNDGQSGSTLRA